MVTSQCRNMPQAEAATTGPTTAATTGATWLTSWQSCKHISKHFAEPDCDLTWPGPDQGCRCRCCCCCCCCRCVADTNCSLLYLYHEQPWQQQLPVIKNAGTLRGAGPQEARNVARRGRHKARMRQERGKRRQK